MSIHNDLQEIFLPAPDKSIWISFAWDGFYYYFTIRNSSLIYQYNCSYECIGHFDANRQYNRICYDYQSDCFWAASKSFPNTVYKLNHSLQEVDKIWFSHNSTISGDITGLSYNCACNELLIAFPDKIMSLNTINKRFHLLNNICGGYITDILSIYPGYIIIQETMSRQYVLLFNHCNCEIEKKLIPASFQIEQIIYIPCNKEPVFHCLATKGKCHSVIIPQCIFSEKLGFQINCCYCECCKHYFPCEKHDMIGCQDDASVIQSIALMEVALAHILNAEGQKLQKVLAETNNIHTIMCVNQQVMQTIIHVTHLEHVLYDKLAVLQKNCCEKRELNNCM